MIGSARLALGLRRGPRLLEAAALLVTTRVVLAASPRRLTAGLVRRASASGPGLSSASERRARAVANDVDLVAPLIRGSTCLSRALTGWLMLQRRGVPCAVRVGAQQRAGVGVRMHAWLEVGGAALIGQDEAADFVALTR